jgi:hypothetical protein
VQAVAWVDDQVRVALPPVVTALGPTLKLTVGRGALTDTVVAWEALPPGPAQVRVYVAPLVSAPVDWVPLAALLPDQAPEAVQDVALVEDQVSIELPPDVIELGAELRVTVGAEEPTETIAD